MYEEFVLNEVNLDFFKDIEENHAFCFTMDEKGRFVPVKEPKYHLFESDIYPFLIFQEELSALNQYCYETAQSVKRYVAGAMDNFQWHRDREESYLTFPIFTKHEIMLSCIEEMYLCERMVWHSASHLVVLLYSFLERAIKKIWMDMFCEDEKKIVFSPSHVKLYAWIEKIFCMSIHELSEKYPDIYQQIDLVRKYRNRIVHGMFKFVEDNEEYEEVKELPPFQLIELIELISTTLDLVEMEYLAKTNLV